ncbi:rhodanese-like domain-containing protein [Candidatus Saccharibacteria bacterium]|jgi:phage shock protein E|nr:rhodanese-like domain-containing protein [Candidatus Saccharibacteria bacterium]
MSRVVIDVRQAAEFDRGHYLEAVNIPLKQIKKIIKTHPDINLDDEIIVYCESGYRSGIARRKLVNLGFASVDSRVNQHQIN